VTSVKRASRIAFFSATVGAGLLIGAGAAAATAEAAPSGSANPDSAHSTSVGHHAPASKAAAKTDTKNTARAQTITLTKPTAPTAAATTTPRLTVVRTATATAPASASVKPATAQALTSLPTPATVQKAVQALVANIALAVQHQIQGIQYNLNVLANDIFGITRTPSGPPSPQDDVYGNYAANVKYWIYQGNEATCLLMAVAGVIGQLSPGHTMPAKEDIITEASTTVSDVRGDGRMIYEGKGTQSVDAVKLLERHGISADLTIYTKSQGQLALDNMTAALADGQGVIVSIHNWALYNSYFGRLYDDFKRGDFQNLGTDILESNHSIIVLSVDYTTNTVYLNDSAWNKGQGLPVPLDGFMKAWQLSNYSTITAELAPQNASTQPTIAA
jgi:hypothetical protein